MPSNTQSRVGAERSRRGRRATVLALGVLSVGAAAARARADAPVRVVVTVTPGANEIGRTIDGREAPLEATALAASRAETAASPHLRLDHVILAGQDVVPPGLLEAQAVEIKFVLPHGWSVLAADGAAPRALAGTAGALRSRLVALGVWRHEPPLLGRLRLVLRGGDPAEDGELVELVGQLAASARQMAGIDRGRALLALDQSLPAGSTPLVTVAPSGDAALIVPRDTALGAELRTAEALAAASFAAVAPRRGPAADALAFDQALRAYYPLRLLADGFFLTEGELLGRVSARLPGYLRGDPVDRAFVALFAFDRALGHGAAGGLDPLLRALGRRGGYDLGALLAVAATELGPGAAGTLSLLLDGDQAALTRALRIARLVQLERPTGPALRPDPAPYEDSLIGAAMAERWRERDPAPEGKRVGTILVLPHDVILPTDVAAQLQLFNVLHSTTRARIVRQELLFSEGDAWSADRVAESSRNLRRNLFVALARITPMRSPRPGEVDVLVTTKDLWSLRLNMNFAISGFDAQSLTFRFTEANLLGLNKSSSLNFSLDPASYLLGATYTDPRLLGSRLYAQPTANVIFTRADNRVEGLTAGLAVGQPLYSLSTAWAWRADADFSEDVFRSFVGGRVRALDDPETPEKEALPYSFDRRSFVGLAEVTRSFGETDKLNLAGGWRGSVRRNTLPRGFPATSDAAREWFLRARVPHDEDAAALYLHVGAFRAAYETFTDINRFALTEDFRFGPGLALDLAWADPAFGFGVRYLDAGASASWRFRLGDDMLLAGLDGGLRRQEGVVRGTAAVNRTVGAVVYNVTPTFLWSRLHTMGLLRLRDRLAQPSPIAFGGEGTLRGYPTNVLQGDQVWNATVELRTQPLVWRTIHGGLVAFADAGDAFDRPAEIGLVASVGAGLRLMFPQVNNQALRIDVAVPLRSDYGATYLFAQFGQAFNF